MFTIASEMGGAGYEGNLYAADDVVLMIAFAISPPQMIDARSIRVGCEVTYGKVVVGICIWN